MRNLSLAFLALTSALVMAGDPETTALVLGDDPSIKFHVKGRAANIELAHSGKSKEGHTQVDYQDGSGFVEYDRASQTLNFEPKIGYTLNRVASHIQKVAPYMHAYLPQKSVVDFSMDVNSMGLGTLNFQDLNVSAFKLEVRYGDVDVDFPTPNETIFRGEAKFNVSWGDLEVTNLANLKAPKIKINGGGGEISAEFGPKILTDTEIKADLDMGTAVLTFPKGTRVVITGTNRDMSKFGFKKIGEIWEPESFSDASPTVTLKLSGPVGSVTIGWK